MFNMMITGNGEWHGSEMERCPFNVFFGGGGVNFESINYVPHVDYLRTRHYHTAILSCAHNICHCVTDTYEGGGGGVV